MPDRRAVGRLHGVAWRLPAVLLSGLFVFVTAGLPASGTSPYTRESTAETDKQNSAGATLAAENRPAEVISPAGPPATGPGLVPPASTGTIVSPLDLYLLSGSGRVDDAVLIQTMTASAHPDRAPPVTGQQ